MGKKTIDLEIGQKLVEMRKLRGLTQKDVGNVLGVTAQQIRKYEIGINGISASGLYKICAHFGVSVTSFYEADTIYPQSVESTGGIKSPEGDRQFNEFVQLYIGMSPKERDKFIRMLKAWTEGASPRSSTRSSVQQPSL